MRESPTPAPPAGRESRVPFFLAAVTVFAGFLIFGLSENIRGPAIPRIQADFALGEMRVGLLLALNSLGYLLACFFTAGLARRIGLRTALLACLAAMAASGVAICLAPNYPALAAGFFLLYIGNGMLEVTLGLMAAAAFTQNTGAMMNLSHFFYGLGSSIAPMLSAGLMAARLDGEALGWRRMYLLVLALSLLPAVPALLGRARRKGGARQKSGYRAFLSDRTAWLIIAMLSLAVTCELGMGGWLANYTEKAHGFSTAEGAAALTAFFVCFTLSRLLLGPLIDRIGFVRSLLACAAFTAAAVLLSLPLGRPGVALLAAAGFGVGPVYPTVMALLARLYRENIEAAMTVTLTVTGLAIVLSNLLLGAVVEAGRRLLTPALGEEAGAGAAYAAGLGVIGLCAAAAFAAALLLRRRLKRAGKLL